MKELKLKILDILKQLLSEGWNLTKFESGNELKVVCTKDAEQNFTVVILYPSIELRDWLANEVDKPPSGLGALFG